MLKSNLISTLSIFTALAFPVAAQEGPDLFYFIQETNAAGFSAFPEKRNQVRLLSIGGKRDIKLWHEWPNDLDTPEGSPGVLTPEGRALIAGTIHEDKTLIDVGFPIGAHGTLRLLDPDGSVVWEHTHCDFDLDGTENSARECLHHDIELMPNGNILANAYTKVDADWLVEQGWDRANTNDPDAGHLWLDTVYEFKPIFGAAAAEACNGAPYCTEVVWSWAAADHLGANDPAKIDINAVDSTVMPLVQLKADQTHLNSLDYSPERDQILMSSFGYDELWVIDRPSSTEEAAGPAGDLRWRWGWPDRYGCGGQSGAQCAPRVLNQHDALWITPEGAQSPTQIMLHNNNSSPETGPLGSQILMLDLMLNDDGSFDQSLPYGPAEAKILFGQTKWEGGKPLFNNVFASGAHLLADGGLIITLTDSKQIWRIDGTPDIPHDSKDKILWKAKIPPKASSKNGQIYKAHVLTPDDPAITALAAQLGDAFAPAAEYPEK